MIRLLIFCVITTVKTYAQRYEYYFSNEQQNDGQQMVLFNNNFSESELNVINRYKNGANSRHFNMLHDIFDSRLFDNRRVFDWVSNLIRKNKSQNKEAFPKKPKYEDIVNDKIYYLQLTKNLTDNITKLTSVLDQFTKTIKEKTYIDGSRRRVRSVRDDSSKFDNRTVNVTVTVTATDSSVAGEATDNAASSQNVSATDVNVKRTNISSEQSTGRRNVNASVFQTKIIAVINNTLNIIKYKIKLVSEINEIFSDRLLYRVGYISGSLSAVRAFVDALQDSVGKNQGNMLLDSDILRMYRIVNKIKVRSEELLELLNRYVYKATGEIGQKN